MSEDHDKRSEPMPAAAGNQLSASAQRWMSELGAEIESLAQMMRSPTTERPFVYECRIDLLPAKGDQAMMILKGFGADGGLVMFNNENGFLSLLRGTEGRLRSGKGKWYDDQYAPNNYEARLKRYLKGEFYRVQ